MKEGEPVEWYTICGTPFENRAEYIFVVSACAIMGMAIYYQWMARSGATPVDPVKTYKKKKE